MNAQFHRFAREELVPGIDFVPTYGNTLMGLACCQAVRPGRRLRDHLLPARPARDLRDRRSRRSGAHASTTARRGRVMLTTLTREFFMPRFPERDEGERAGPASATRGTASATCACSGSSRARSSWGSTDRRRGPRNHHRQTHEGSTMLHIPLLRAGKPYRSLRRGRWPTFATASPWPRSARPTRA